MDILPSFLKKLMYKLEKNPCVYQSLLKPNDVAQLLKDKYVDHLQIGKREEFVDENLLSGIDVWLIQTFLAVTVNLPSCTYEDFISAIFQITSGVYFDVDPSLLAAFLAQPTAVYLMQNPQLKRPSTSKKLSFYVVMLRFVYFRGRLFDVCQICK